MSVQTGRDPPEPPAMPSPEEAAEAARAAAEVAAMEPTANGRRRDPTGDEAVMGAAANEEGVAGFEVTDETGEHVRQRFVDFLASL